jgi:hypothetical protein
VRWVSRRRLRERVAELEETAEQLRVALRQQIDRGDELKARLGAYAAAYEHAESGEPPALVREPGAP